MGFLDQLAKNPRGSVYNPGGGQEVDFGPTLSAINQLKDREMNDYKQKAQFNQELSLRQPRLAQIYAPPQTSGSSGIQQGQPNVVFGGEDKSAGLASPMQQESINQNKQELDLQGKKIDQQGKFGDQKIAQMQQTHDLAKQKSDQIFQTKQAEMQRKVDESNNKLGLAYDQLNQKGNSADALAAIKQAQIDAQKAQMEFMNHQHESQLEELKRTHDMTNQHLRDQLAETTRNNKAKNEQDTSTETTELDASGNKKTVTKTKGSSKTIRVTGPNGQKGTVSADETLPSGWSAEGQ